MSGLRDRLKQVGNGKAATGKVQSAAPAKPDNKKSPHYRPSRSGKKAIIGYFDPAVSKQVRQLALDEDTSVEALVGEALDLLFEQRGLPQIAGKQPD
ncbi:hypothetical protein S7335_784 [Synechococcus sp. PCC 7335]|uniref:ribbon-helix-helix domain-containing protein n=1 Tax=Synechococcus sp. (strain ATCC 29403 / PCC 7335) TaxID=91464 RepID=UPI00017EBCAD|nr:ribbon-helix-helix domain-containing protein [Synechococcus sp. PCC 7335]EDX83540.1 hypothetical protein S7335_720 [Synechococcus sp. PCC 7335]EDX83604.1 hypothetical protein S7335_784 [Synechococcus sp. PCC 7335]